METNQKITRFVVSVLVLAGLAVFSLTAGGGTLQPPGPPTTGTMKTLDEVEPRKAVQSLPGDADSLYVINESGSYYLTGNITGVASKHGIEIKAKNVTLDLMGFSITGVAGSGNGIKITEGPLPVEEVAFTYVIRNGRVCNWGGDGLQIGPKTLNHMENVSFTYNTGNGMSLGSESYTHMEQVSFAHNDGNGLYIDVNSYAHMEDVSFAYNTNHGAVLGMYTNVDAYSGYASHNGGNGMYIANESCSHMEDMSFAYNGGHGVFMLYSMLDAFGVLAPHNGGGGIIVTGSGNLNRCTAVANGGNGIETGSGSTIRNCTTRNNKQSGILVSDNCCVAANTCEGNRATVSADAAGIRATGSGNRIEANHVVNNDKGVVVDSAGNLIIKNSATANTTNYDIAGGNTKGPTIGSGDISDTNPHANYDL